MSGDRLVVRALGLAAWIWACGPAASAGEPPFPALPLPPAVNGLVGFPNPATGGRALYLGVLGREAERHGMPPALADAVAAIESAYRPGAVGGVGEIGLMQVRPETAAMLGHRGGATDLFDPAVNIRYGVAYLARAWRLAGGDVCRALMKYRAGWGEERMTPLSVEYCRRARAHLAAVGSPLAGGAVPSGLEAGAAWPAGPGRVGRSITAPGADAAWTLVLQRARLQARSPGAGKSDRDRVRFWAAHEARIRAIRARFERGRQVLARRI